MKNRMSGKNGSFLILKTFGILALVFLMLVSIAGAASFESGTWKGEGTYNSGRSSFDMNLTVNVQGNTFTGTLEEIIYSGIMKVNGKIGDLSSFSTSDQRRLATVIKNYGTGTGKFIVFTDPIRVKGWIAADCTYYAVVNADGSLQGIWAYPGTTSSIGDGTLSLKRASGTVTVKPVAAFTASPTSGTNPLKVQFTDQSTNNPTSWKWDFGDGSATSTTHNPLHTYIKVGTHKVTLTATNAAGSSTVTKTAYIKVTNPVKPVAAFTASPTSGTKPLKVQFTDKSTGSPTSWKWDFGDGTTSTTHNPLHTYIKKGKLTVTLTVKNSAGTSTKTMTSYITVK